MAFNKMNKEVKKKNFNGYIRWGASDDSTLLILQTLPRN